MLHNVTAVKVFFLFIRAAAALWEGY